MNFAALISLLSVSLLPTACVPAYANEEPDAQAVFSTPIAAVTTRLATVIPTPLVSESITPKVTPLPEHTLTLPHELELLMTQVAAFPH